MKGFCAALPSGTAPLKSLASYLQLQHCHWTCIRVCFGSKRVNIIEKITTLCCCPAVMMSSVQFKKDKLPQVFVVSDPSLQQREQRSISEPSFVVENG